MIGLISRSPSGDGNSANWWNFLTKNEKSLPKQKYRKNSVDRSSPEFENYLKSLNKFNELLLEEIRVIEGNANKLLKDTFKENIKLTFSYHDASFNHKNLGILFPPTITIKANMTNPRVADCGCHDNRMDKIWWNELWMGYPVDESYVRSSNVANAHLLRRPLMLVVGELDDNVDPASTMQVADALIKANKEFELVVIPGASSSSKL